MVPTSPAAASGEIDATFGTAGKVLQPIESGTKNDLGNAMAIDAMGRIVVAGKAATRIAVARFTADGALDTSFGASMPTNGKAILSTGALATTSAEAFAVAVQPADGKIVLAGSSTQASHDRTTLVRLLSGGALDATFGMGGVVTTPLSPQSDNDQAQGLALQGDGRIVVAGTVRTNARRDLLVARYTTSGVVDTTFSGDGIVRLDLGADKDEDGYAVALDADGRILVAGSAAPGASSDFLVARFTSAGALDASFGDGGVVTIDFSSRTDVARALAPLPDGRILVVGESTTNDSGFFALARLDEDGELDDSFGTAGRVLTAIGDRALARAVTLHPRGRFTVAGRVRLTANFDFAAAQYRKDGNLDPTFGTAGATVVPVGNRNDEANAVALQGAGAVVLAGTARTGSNADFGLVRLLLDDCGDGVLDAGEGCDGDDLGGATCCSTTCTVLGAGSTCRAASGACDLPEVCTGSSATCPADAVKGAGTACRDVQGPCDLAESCDGTSPSCPADAKVATGTACRSAAGVCDLAESCDGLSAACPADARAGASVVCRAAIDACDAAETCNGSALDCPPDVARAAGAVCRAATDLCDAVETCDGAGFACPADEVSPEGTTCRAVAGACDVAETCDGAVKSCPADVVVPAGTSCRAAADACDAEETCDGTSGTCPLDVGLPDGDLDGVCDVEDVCPTVSDPAQTDGDEDGLGDACDPCTGGPAVTKPKIEIAGYATPPGDDTFRFRGILILPGAPEIAPEANGVRVRIEDASGHDVLDVTVPPGAFQAGVGGWEVNARRTLFKFRSPTPVAGWVNKVKMTRRLSQPGRYEFKVTGNAAAFAGTPPTMPLKGILGIDPPNAASGICGEATFPGPEPICAFDLSLGVLDCR
jgi:uncharacterized delta-60 repeat protein